MVFLIIGNIPTKYVVCLDCATSCAQLLYFNEVVKYVNLPVKHATNFVMKKLLNAFQ